MALIIRYLQTQILQDLEKKMVFLGGPRQVGKTTFSRSLYAKSSYLYLNWDIDSQRTQILTKEFDASELIIFDEIHKYKKWRNYLKVLFDAIKTNSVAQKKF